MNMNSDKRDVLSHHKIYLACLEKKMWEFTEQKELQKDEEWCMPEKQNYLNSMKLHLPTEYENIMRF